MLCSQPRLVPGSGLSNLLCMWVYPWRHPMHIRRPRVWFSGFLHPSGPSLLRLPAQTPRSLCFLCAEVWRLGDRMVSRIHLSPLLASWNGRRIPCQNQECILSFFSQAFHLQYLPPMVLERLSGEVRRTPCRPSPSI